jgi:23S rRNA (uracil1939-C5)-methyltransferase
MNKPASHEQDGPVLTIARLGDAGDGIATHGGREIFVPRSLPGDVVRVRMTDATRADIIAFDHRALTPRPPACPHVDACGGCAVQHFPDSIYTEWKAAILTRALTRAGFPDLKPDPLVCAAPRTRRRATLAARRRGRDINIGFHAPRRHEIVDVADCAILVPALVTLLDPLRRALRAILDDRETCDLGVTASESGIDLLIIGDHVAEPTRRSAWTALAETLDLARLATAATIDATPEIVVQRRPVLQRLADIPVEPPPHVFLQPTAAGERAIVDAVREAVGGARRLADLYAGCGTITLPLARDGAHVLAIDSAPQAIAALDHAARAHGLGPVIRTAIRDLARRPLLGDELSAFDAVVFDPPRDGAAEQAAALAASRVNVIVAVSCNPATFARDARLLREGGYELERVTPIDQFLWSRHLELVAVFRRKPAISERKPRGERRLRLARSR